MIHALPQILSKRKNIVYIVAGATHPHILRREGTSIEAVCGLWPSKSEWNHK